MTPSEPADRWCPQARSPGRRSSMSASSMARPRSTEARRKLRPDWTPDFGARHASWSQKYGPSRTRDEPTEDIPPADTHSLGSLGTEFPIGRVKLKRLVRSGPVVVLDVH